jgi:hypothetical protein
MAGETEAMRVTVKRNDGSQVNGRIIRSEALSLFVSMHGATELAEFRFNLGDWISPAGDMISYELCEQLPGTYLRLRALAQAANDHRLQTHGDLPNDWCMPRWVC